MPAVSLDDLAPETEVLVSPIHLAGPGSQNAVYNVLQNAAGWSKPVVFEADAYYTSPCQRVRIANAAESRYGGWTIAYAEDPLGVPDWITTFDRNTPQEIVAAFTQILVDGLPNHFLDYLSGGPHYTGLSPAVVLNNHDWEPRRGTEPFVTVAPDGHAALRMRGGWLHEYDELLSTENSMWRLSGGLDPIRVPAWSAYFSRFTPEHLRTAAVTAVTSPIAVPRFACDIPRRHHPLVDVHLAELNPPTARAQAAQTRRPYTAHACAPAPAASPPPTTSHGGSRRQR